MRRRNDEPGRERRADGTTASRVGLGLLGKITVFLVAILVPLAAVSWTLAYRSLQDNLTREFTDKGSAIANSLASSGADLIVNRDASTVQAQVDEFAKINGVAYVMVYDAQFTLVAHTFAPVVPKGIVERNVVPGQSTKPQVKDITYVDPRTGREREIIDIGVPMLGGQLGTVRVGMDRSIITTAAVQSGNSLLLTFSAIAGVAVLAGVIFARRITRPMSALMSGAERVGRGDLSQLVPVTSRDEIGQMAVTFNDSIVRLRALVQTEADRDEERRKREDLQQNIIKFLDTAVEIGKGDFTRRGEVTWDVLGNVVDAINLMVEEIGSLVGDVRKTALQVAAGSRDTIKITGDLAEAAQTQSADANRVTQSVTDVTVSVRQVADSADQSAKAARQVLQAASKGEEAVRNSLASMQQIRAEVQTISKKIKSLGDRSLEISDIVNTIQDIAAQTHLLALNASIEAAGAGEAGLRFSVVADEVRKLAERATQATRDIGTLIKGVQVETQEAVVAMESGTREVESGYEVSLKAEEALQEIGKISQASSELAGEISQASQQQVRGSEAVAGAVQAIASAATRTEQGVLQSRRNVEQLARLAEELTVKLSRFKLAS
ncbi:MAG TPA: methyl-accepting chemotaxis protein [Methylomirabilota bacterium]|jgi:twitching motility protein PilJ|nr:methyl-accepting chemotaxis protein [Methylomirabilota bacterium]